MIPGFFSFLFFSFLFFFKDKIKKKEKGKRKKKKEPPKGTKKEKGKRSACDVWARRRDPPRVPNKQIQIQILREVHG
jgi:hypothetical protein